MHLELSRMACVSSLHLIMNLTLPQIASGMIALLIFVALAVGRVPALRLNRVAIAMVAAGVVMVTAVNIGSAATITGNPQNILLGISSGIPYLTFLARLGPVSLLGMAIAVVVVSNSKFESLITLRILSNFSN